MILRDSIIDAELVKLTLENVIQSANTGDMHRDDILLELGRIVNDIDHSINMMDERMMENM